MDCILKYYTPFLLQICPKLCYFIYEYAYLNTSYFREISEKNEGSRSSVHRSPLRGSYRQQNQTEDQKLVILGEKFLWIATIKIPKYLLWPI